MATSQNQPDPKEVFKKVQDLGKEVTETQSNTKKALAAFRELKTDPSQDKQRAIVEEFLHGSAVSEGTQKEKEPDGKKNDTADKENKEDLSGKSAAVTATITDAAKPAGKAGVNKP